MLKMTSHNLPTTNKSAEAHGVSNADIEISDISQFSDPAVDILKIFGSFFTPEFRASVWFQDGLSFVTMWETLARPDKLNCESDDSSAMLIPVGGVGFDREGREFTA